MIKIKNLKHNFLFYYYYYHLIIKTNINYFSNTEPNENIILVNTLQFSFDH